MPIAMLVGSVAVPAIGSLVGQLASSGAQADAQKAQQQALKTIMGVQAPTAEQLQVDLARYQQTGEVTPALQSVISQQQSEMAGISVNPALRQAQMQALQKLQQQGAGGLQPQDLAALAQVQQQAAGQAQAQQASALQAMQQRGLGGGGSELAARLSAAQGAANTAMMGGLDIQGQAAQRALQAIAQSGQLGGQMEAQQFGESAQKAQAQDIINKFNAANAQQVQAQNIAAQNQAQYYNLGQQQQIANLNVQSAQEQARQHAQAQQQAYQNALQKAGAQAGALGTAAQQDLQRAGQTQQMWSGMGQGIGQGLGAGASYMANMPKLPKTTSNQPVDLTSPTEQSS